MHLPSLTTVPSYTRVPKGLKWSGRRFASHSPPSQLHPSLRQATGCLLRRRPAQPAAGAAGARGAGAPARCGVAAAAGGEGVAKRRSCNREGCSVSPRATAACGAAALCCRCNTRFHPACMGYDPAFLARRRHYLCALPPARGSQPGGCRHGGPPPSPPLLCRAPQRPGGGAGARRWLVHAQSMLRCVRLAWV